MSLASRLSIAPLSNTFDKPSALTYSAKNTVNKFGTSSPTTAHHFSNVNSKLTFSAFDTLKMAEVKMPKTRMDTLFQFLFSNAYPPARTNLLPWENTGVLGAYYALGKPTSHDSSSSLDKAWIDESIELKKCMYKRKSCPRVLTGVTILSWAQNHVKLFPELMCLLSR